MTVRDTGVGIPEQDQERIFEAFQRGGLGPRSTAEGTGLGLTLSKRIVELHGGRLWLTSRLGVRQHLRVRDPGPPGGTGRPRRRRRRRATRGAADRADGPRDRGRPPLGRPAAAAPGGGRLRRRDCSRRRGRAAARASGSSRRGAARCPAPATRRVGRARAPEGGPCDRPPARGHRLDGRRPRRRLSRSAPPTTCSSPFAASRSSTRLRVACATPATRRSVVAIDDDPVDLDLIEAVLEPEGYTVLRARGGEEGLAHRAARTTGRRAARPDDARRRRLRLGRAAARRSDDR